MSATEIGRVAAEPIALDAQHPWPSLQAFREEYSRLFKGRDREIADLVRRVKRRLLTVLFGVSGLGKTSLLQAGLFPALRRAHFLPVLIRLDHEDQSIELTAQVRREFARALAEQRIEANASTEDEDLWSLFHLREAGWKSADGKPVVPVLVFDQFEELFTRRAAGSDGDSQRRHFLGQLAALVENRPPDSLSDAMEKDPALVERFDFRREDYRVVISLREDYLPQLEELSRRMPSIMENRLRLTRMTQEQALEAVIGPGKEVVSETVAREIVAFVAGSSMSSTNGDSAPGPRDVDPSLLSLICSELNAQRLAEGLPLITSELLLGRSNRILDEFYSRCFEFLPEEKRQIAQAFVEDRLLTPAGHRGTVALESAESELEALEVGREALQQLVSHRLLQFDERHGLQRVELAHDILTTVVGRHRDRRRELQAVEQQRRQEQRELAEAREREGAALSQVKHLRRTRFTFAAVGLLFAGLCVCSLWFAANFRRAKQDLQVKNAELAQSSQQIREANAAVEKLVDQLTSALLDEVAAARGAQISTLQRVVQRGLQAFREVPPQFAATPRMRINRSEMLQASAEAYIAQNPREQFDQARKMAAEAVSELRSAAMDAARAAGPDEGMASSPSSSPVPPGAAVKTGVAQDDLRLISEKLVAALLTLGDIAKTRVASEPTDVDISTLEPLFADAQKSYGEAAEIAERVVNRSDRHSPAFAAALAKSLVRQADLIRERWARSHPEEGQDQEILAKRRLLDDALAQYQRAFEICSGLDANDPMTLSMLADLHNKVGNVYAWQAARPSATRDQEFDQAQNNYSEALKFRQQVLDRNPASIADKRALGYTFNNLARLYEMKREDSRWSRHSDRRKLAADAEKLYNQRLELSQEIARTDPENFLYQTDLGEAFRHLAAFYQADSSTRARALPLYQQAVAATHGQNMDALDDLIKAAEAMHREDVAGPARQQLDALAAKSEPAPLGKQTSE